MSELEREREWERERYRALYSGEIRTRPRKPHYGIANHGKWAWPIIEELRPSSIVDVGTGNGEFCRQCVLNGIGRVAGVDFASVVDGLPKFRNAREPRGDHLDSRIEYYDYPAHKMLFADNEFDMLTAFDMLEHVLPDEVDEILSEFGRVANSWLFSIAYVESHDVLGKNLHRTVRDVSWWKDRISSLGKVESYSPPKEELKGSLRVAHDVDMEDKYLFVRKRSSPLAGG